MRRLLALVLVPLVLAAPAQALGGYAPPQRVADCAAAGQVVAVADTSLWGVIGCGSSALRLVHRTPSGVWSSRALPFSGSVRAVADDGRSTFYLFSPPYQPQGTPLYIAQVPHGGSPSPSRLLTRGGEEVPSASLVARDGKWWAVWDAVVYGGDMRSERTSSVWQARSIAPAFAPRPALAGAGLAPHLALRGDGAVLGFSRPQGADGFGTTQPVLAVADRSGAFAERTLGVSTPEGGTVADLTVSGGRTGIVVRSGTRTLLALDDLALRFTTREVLTRAVPRVVRMAMSGGRVFVAHSECFTASTGRFTCRVYVAEGGVSGSLTTTEVSAPLGRQDAGVQAAAESVTAARGRATVLSSVQPSAGRGSTVAQTQQ